MVKRRQAPVYAQALYDALALRSRRDFGAYETPRPWPVREVPGELAFFLDDLIQHAGILDGRKPDDAVAEVIDLGIVAWYGKLSRKARAKLGLSDLVAQGAGATPGAGKPSAPAKKVPDETDHDVDDDQSAFLKSPDTSSGYILLTAHERPAARTAPASPHSEKKPRPRHKKRRRSHK